jgi:hypothetical protein
MFVISTEITTVVIIFSYLIRITCVNPHSFGYAKLAWGQVRGSVFLLNYPGK